MKKQVVIIHGGNSFRTYEDYISYLKTKKVNTEKLKPRKEWKDELATKLGDGYEILMPRMPNGTNAQYEEWKIWFKRIAEVLDNNLILIGHSLGGIFLAKYLSRNIFKKRIIATILVAAPFEDPESTDGQESLEGFVPPSSLKKFAKQGGKIYLLHSKDDPVVPFSQLAKYQDKLPKAKTIIFENKEHFNQGTFPEIIKLIQSI